MKKRLCRFK